MNICRLPFFVLAAALGAFSAPSHAQTPASNAPGAYQPLSPTAVNVGTLGCKTVPGNLVGQYVSENGTSYVVETRKGRIVVDRWALLGLPNARTHPGRGRPALANAHSFR